MNKNMLNCFFLCRKPEEDSAKRYIMEFGVSIVKKF